MRRNPYQLAALAACLLHILCLSLFYALYAAPRALYVSDVLFSLIEYRVLLTLLALAEMLFVFLSTLRLGSDAGCAFGLEALFLATSVAGWVLLTSTYKTADLAIHRLHFIGTGMYIAGNVGTSAYMAYEIHRAGKRWALGVLVVLVAASLGLGAGFIGGFYDHKGGGWVCEHLGVVSLSVTHLFFFALWPPDPLRKERLYDPVWGARIDLPAAVSKTAL